MNELSLDANGKQTNKTIRIIAQILSDIKAKFVPHQKNWEEYGLKVYAKGLTTTPIPIETADGIEALDLNINLVEHKLKIFFSDKRDLIALIQPDMKTFFDILMSNLNSFGIEFSVDERKYNFSELLNYDTKHSKDFWDLLRRLYFMFLDFRGSLLEETSNINLWAHHFDLSMLLFSGKLISDQDPNDWDNSREQMNFGFSFSEEGVGEPYFYVTFYPFKNEYLNYKLPEFAYWNTEGWNGVVVKFGEDKRAQIQLKEVTTLFAELKRMFLSGGI